MGIERHSGLSKIHDLMSLRRGLCAILWATSGIAWGIARLASPRHFGTGSAILYVVVATSLVVSLIATMKFPFPIILSLPLLVVFSTTVHPSLKTATPYQTGLFVVRTVVILTIAAGAVSFRLKNTPLSRKSLGVVAAGNLILVATIIVGSGSLALVSSIQHEGQAIQVKTVTLQKRVQGQYDFRARILSHPLMEGSTAFVATEAGILHEIDLPSGRVTRKLQLPRPEPSEVGLRDLVKHPKAASACQTHEAAITRLSADRLSVSYPFSAGTGTGLGWGESLTFRRIDVVVDLAGWKVAEWALVEGFMPEEPESTHLHGGWIVHVSNNSFDITGPGIRTYVYTRGEVGWVMSTDEYILVSDTSGRVYVIKVE